MDVMQKACNTLCYLRYTLSNLYIRYYVLFSIISIKTPVLFFHGSGFQAVLLSKTPPINTRNSILKYISKEAKMVLTVGISRKLRLITRAFR